MPSHNDNDDEDSEEEYSEEVGDYDDDGNGLASAGIMQFDPTAADNVKIVRSNSMDEFPTDYLGCAVDMGLTGNEGDEQDDNSNHGNKNNADTPATTEEHSFFGKTGLSIFGQPKQPKLLRKSNSFKFGKGSSHNVSNHDDAADEGATTPSSTMGAVMSMFSSGGGHTSMFGSSSGAQEVGHQQLGDGDDDEFS